MYLLASGDFLMLGGLISLLNYSKQAGSFHFRNGQWDQRTVASKQLPEDSLQAYLQKVQKAQSAPETCSSTSHPAPFIHRHTSSSKIKDPADTVLPE